MYSAAPARVDEVSAKAISKDFSCRHTVKKQLVMESCRGFCGSPCEEGKLDRWSAWAWNKYGYLGKHPIHEKDALNLLLVTEFHSPV